MMAFTATWMDLKTVILSEVRHKGEISHGISYMWNLKRNDTNEFAKQTHGYREWTYGCHIYIHDLVIYILFIHMFYLR